MNTSTGQRRRRTPEEDYLLRNGCPALVPGFTAIGSVLRRPGPLALWTLTLAVLVGVAMAFYGLSFGSWWWLLPVSLLFGAIATALSLHTVLRFGLRTMIRSFATGAAGSPHALPWLLIAVTFFFLAAETWQAIGTLRGIPLVASDLLLILLAVVFLLRTSRIRSMNEFPPGTELPPGLPSWLPAELPAAPPPLTVGERFNLSLISVFGRLLVASVIGGLVTVFFAVFGLIAVTEATAISWSGLTQAEMDPLVWFSFGLDGHTYTLTAVHMRVAVFLGAFSTLYLVVSAATDQQLRDTLSRTTDAHIRGCLAVRAAQRSALVAG